MLDERVGEVLRVKFWLGLFDEPYVLNINANDVVHNDEAQELALESAQQSITLLKNENLLPLDKNRFGTIAVIGPNAVEKRSMLSRYGPVHVDIKTNLDAIKDEFSESEILFAQGCAHIDPNFPASDVEYFHISDEEELLMKEAEDIALKADVVILSVGDNIKTVGESASRLSLDLPGRQNELIDRIVATGKPVVLVHTGGRPASMVKASKTCGAIVQNFYAGEFGADALAGVLSGKYNPSGKLPVGILKHVGQVPLAFPLMPADANKGNAAVAGFLYPFGHGLSYTR